MQLTNTTWNKNSINKKVVIVINDLWWVEGCFWSRKLLLVSNDHILKRFWKDFEKILKWFWKDFEKILKRFWKDSEKILKRFWKGFEKILKRFWKDFEKILKRFWKDFEKILKRFWKEFEKILKRFWKGENRSLIIKLSSLRDWKGWVQQKYQMSGVRFFVFVVFNADLQNSDFFQRSSVHPWLMRVDFPRMHRCSMRFMIVSFIGPSRRFISEENIHWLKHKMKIIFGIIVNQKFWTPLLPSPLSSMMASNNIRRGGAASDPRVKFHEHMLWLKF
jgi:hypothetical protein